MLLDVKCAFLYGYVKRDIYIELPPEDAAYKSGMVGKLVKAMYGTRDAPLIWQETVEANMQSLGFLPSKLHPSVYFHRERGLRVLAHVDDFMCTGSHSQLKWLYDELSKDYELKSKMIGEMDGLEKEGSFLNRIVRWTETGIEFERGCQACSHSS